MDTDITERIRLGDQTALSQVADRSAPIAKWLYKKYGGPLISREDIDEQVADATVSVWERREEIAPERGSVFTLVANKARFLCIDLLRKRGQSSTDIASSQLDCSNVESTNIVRSVYSELSDQENQMVEQILAGMTDSETEILFLFLRLGWKATEEIAEALDKKPKTVRKIKSTAMRRIRNNLEALGINSQSLSFE